MKTYTLEDITDKHIGKSGIILKRIRQPHIPLEFWERLNITAYGLDGLAKNSKWNISQRKRDIPGRKQPIFIACIVDVEKLK